MVGRSRKPGFGETHGGVRGLIIAIVCLFGYRLLMEPADIYLIIIVGFFYLSGVLENFFGVKVKMQVG